MEKVEDVKSSLISSRRIIFTPTQDLKDELASTAIQITCYDRNGEIVKRVTSADAGTVEDPNTEGTENAEGTENGGTQNQEGNQNQGGSQNQDGTDTGGGNGGSDTGGDDYDPNGN